MREISDLLPVANVHAISGLENAGLYDRSACTSKLSLIRSPRGSEKQFGLSEVRIIR
jgi:hypothetical protein